MIYILYIHILNFILVHVFGGRGLEMWTNECESFNLKKSNSSIVHLCKVFIIDVAYGTLFTGSHIILDFMVSLLQCWTLSFAYVIGRLNCHSFWRIWWKYYNKVSWLCTVSNNLKLRQDNIMKSCKGKNKHDNAHETKIICSSTFNWMGYPLPKFSQNFAGRYCCCVRGRGILLWSNKLGNVKLNCFVFYGISQS